MAADSAYYVVLTMWYVDVPASFTKVRIDRTFGWITMRENLRTSHIAKGIFLSLANSCSNSSYAILCLYAK
jgi:hypothetical protein